MDRTFKLNLKSNMNMMQIKKLICKHLVSKDETDVPHPGAIALTLNRYSDRAIKDHENGMLLQELFVKNDDKFTVTRRGITEISNMPLLEGTSKKMTQLAKRATSDLFNMFAVASPDAP